MLGQGSLQLPLPDALRCFPLPPLPPPNQLMFALKNVHDYWKSKVFEVHSRWEKLPDSFDIGKLDKRNLSAEKNFEGNKMPTLKLGNRVRIVTDMDKRLFKALHKKVGIWGEGLTELIGKEGIVMDLSSRFMIGVCMIENGIRVYLHGLALEVVNKEVNEGLWMNRTDFKVDDEVTINVELGVLAHLQSSIVGIPYEVAAQLNGLIGRVVCCSRRAVVVTFDERTCVMLNTAALRKYSNKDGHEKSLPKLPGPSDVEKGTRVSVLPKLKEVMRNQFGHGEWSYKMTKFVGKEGAVVDNVPGGDVIVNFSPFESYRMNRESLRLGKQDRTGTRSENEIPEDPLTPFMVGDVVRLNIGQDDLQSNLQLLRIPPEFLVIAGECGEFVGYINLSRGGVVDFGDGIEFIFDIQLLVKVEDKISEEFRKIRKRDRAIEVGSKVMLWIGPTPFVRKCLRNFKDGFEKASEEEATVVGYDEIGNVVIGYKDGKRYLLPDEYVCSPRDIWKKKDNVRSKRDQEHPEVANDPDLEKSLSMSQQKTQEARKEPLFAALSSMERGTSIREPVSLDNSAIPVPPQGVCNIPLPEGVTQVVLQIGGSVQPRVTPVSRSQFVPPQDVGQQSGTILNFHGPISIFGEGGNQMNISDSSVRYVSS